MCEMLIEAMEQRSGSVEGIATNTPVQFLTDNGSTYIVDATRQEARHRARRRSLRRCAVRQNHGVAASAANTCKREMPTGWV